MPQDSFPEFIERDGKRYQIIGEFCRQNGLSAEYVWYRIKTYKLKDPRYVNSIKAGEGIVRHYVLVGQEESLRKRGNPHEAPEFMFEDGRVYSLLENYCKSTGLNRYVVLDRLKRVKDTRLRVEGRKFNVGKVARWYIFLGLKRGDGRLKSLKERGRERVNGGYVRELKEFGKLIGKEDNEDCEEGNFRDVKKVVVDEDFDDEDDGD